MMSVYAYDPSSPKRPQYPRACPNCGKTAFHTFQSRRVWRKLLFLPVVPRRRFRVLVRCNLCGQQTIETRRDAAVPDTACWTKTCPECAEVVKLDARICRFCRHRFDEDETASARHFAEAKAARLAEQWHRQRLLRRATRYALLGWLLVLPGGLWSILVAIALISLIGQGDPGQTALGALFVVWVVMSIPFLFGVWLLTRARRIRQSPEKSPRDAPSSDTASTDGFSPWPHEAVADHADHPD